MRGESDQARTLSIESLRGTRIRSMRNGNWWRLSPTERALYKSAMSLAILRGHIVGRKLVEVLVDLMHRLSETPAVRVMRIGCARAEQMINNFTRKGLTVWAAYLRNNMSNSDFIFCLGLDCINMRAAGVYLGCLT